MLCAAFGAENALIDQSSKQSLFNRAPHQQKTCSFIKVEIP